MQGEPEFTIGIEEEYLLVDPASRNLIREARKELLAECQAELGDQVTPEFLQSQIEVGTRVCTRMDEAAAELNRLRATVSAVAARHGLAIVAASTHPFAPWGDQRYTDRERYRILARDFQGLARRLLIGGMHVHVGIEDEDLRVSLMGQAMYILPHLLALSTSSPFWEGRDTGLMSYRIAVWDELPRTGLPEAFDSHAEFQRHVDTLTRAGLLEDASKLWWDLRPSARFPTLEMRITDVCTRVEDAVCIAAIYRCWLRMLYRLRTRNQRWRTYSSMLIAENRWLAQRYGFAKGLVDFGRGRIVAYRELLHEILALIREDAEHFDCVAEVEHAWTILERGTSAHRQLEVYEQALASGASTKEALALVVDQLLAESVEGTAATSNPRAAAHSTER